MCVPVFPNHDLGRRIQVGVRIFSSRPALCRHAGAQRLPSCARERGDQPRLRLAPSYSHIITFNRKRHFAVTHGTHNAGVSTRPVVGGTGHPIAVNSTKASAVRNISR